MGPPLIKFHKAMAISPLMILNVYVALKFVDVAREDAEWLN